MKLKMIFLFAFFLFQLRSAAQNDFEINSIVSKYPKRFSNPEKLADKINADFKTENAKARAIYSWMAFNIRYDVKKFRNPPKRKVITFKTQEEKQRKQAALLKKQINKTIQTRKGICGDYSALYHRLATLAGLKCEMNQGNARTEKHDIGKKRAVIDHGWNSVQVDGEWKLVDVTWGAGYLDDETDKFVPHYDLFYFDTPQELFFLNHYPEKGIWHDVTVNKNTFLNAPLMYPDDFTDYKIIEPNSGVVTVNKNEKLKFKIENLPSGELKYSLRKQDERAEITSKSTTGNLTEFEIPIDRKIGKFLTLYADGTPIATFKIIQK